MSRSCSFLLILCAAIAGGQAPTSSAIADRLTANGLRADVSFLAADALEGRATPSRGLDVAAEYIASQYRRAGLEPAGDDGYFQSAAFEQATPNAGGLSLTLEAGGQAVHAQNSAMFQATPTALNLSYAPIIKAEGSSAGFGALKAEEVRGKVLVATAFPGASSFLGPPAALHPALLILLRSTARTGNAGPPLREKTEQTVPVLEVWDAEFRKAMEAAKAGPLAARISAHIEPPAITAVKLHNVCGLLRGSDPALKDTYLLVTAHYDHLGMRGTGPGDHIFNGADDDASGTASVMEIAGALAALPRRPRRSVLFVTFFGEELGEVGSRYYVRHPVFPLAKTTADINLEQLGRTDDSTGAHVGMFNLTGFDFTDMPDTFRRAGAESGVRVVKDAKNSDRYFTASDNYPFATAGVPSTTVSVAYEFPDYHRPGDEWQKLDYANMAKVDHALALAVYALADSPTAPRWNLSNHEGARFAKARQTNSGHE